MSNPFASCIARWHHCSSLSQALQYLVVAPGLLQLFAKDKVLAVLNFVAPLSRFCTSGSNRVLF